jgi:peptidyl-dipeptidase Dcp
MTPRPALPGLTHTDTTHMDTTNPLLRPFGTPHDTIPFPEITVSHIEEAIKKGMAREKAEIEAIKANPAAPDFANTIAALEKCGALLETATTLMYNLLSANTSDALEEMANRLSPMLADHGNDIMLDAALFHRVKTVYDNERGTLSGEKLMLLEKTYEGFERSGATLDEGKKTRFREISRQLSQLSLQFSQNVLSDTNAFTLHITDGAQLAGLPQMHIDTAANEAKARGLEGWVFTLKAPSYVPFMSYADNRDLRHQLYMAYNTRCTHGDKADNFATVRQLVELRGKMARLLGYPDYAAYALRRRMAGETKAVESLLDSLIAAYKPQAEKEVAAIEQLAKDEQGKDFRLQPWDFSYYAQKLKKREYDYDPEALRPYLELSRVKQGVFGLAEKLYGVTFRPAPEIPVYHPEVEVYEVRDSDGSYLAVLYMDFFPRESKQGGAWMTNYKDEYCDAPEGQPVTAANSSRPHVSVTTNFTRPTGDKPALLTLGEVETLLHEFGHALHGIFAMTRYAALSGTSVYWDFVELPSQFMENYASEPDFLSTFAQHYQTHEPLPAEYVERIRKSRNFNAAYACMRQVSFGLLDMAYYTLPAAPPADIRAFEHKAWERAQLLPQPEECCMTVQFGHIMSGGYAAGYYSYKWAEVLDADAFALFKENGIFDTATARSFRDNVLSKGGTQPPMELYTRFRGKSPSIDALLARDGITH